MIKDNILYYFLIDSVNYFSSDKYLESFISDFDMKNLFDSSSFKAMIFSIDMRLIK